MIRRKGMAGHSGEREKVDRSSEMTASMTKWTMRPAGSLSRSPGGWKSGLSWSR